jgi:tyrosinase-like protein
VTEGDGIRRNVASIDAIEKQHLKDAIIALHKSRSFPGKRGDPIPGGVSYWFKQDEIHQATHVHGGPAFLTWHRELCNRFEDLLRLVYPTLSLHYWDWTTDPSPLFTSDFMGSARGPAGEMVPAGEPWLKAGFYDPTADPYRGENIHDTTHNNPADPPRKLERQVKSGVPSPPYSDTQIINSPTYQSMRSKLEPVHDFMHSEYIRGTIGDPHKAFRDPFVFLLHSNVDRLFAMWQLRDPTTRLNPNLVYGSESGSSAIGRDVGILTPLEPWAGKDAPGVEEGVKAVRPWAPPENEMVLKNSKHISVVTPRPYDTSIVFTKFHFKEIVKDLDLLLRLKEIPEGKVPEQKEIPEGKVPDQMKISEQMPTDVGFIAERLGSIEERLATMESFIRPDERPQLGKKDRRQVKNHDEKQTEE